MPQYDVEYISLRPRPGRAAEYETQRAEVEIINAPDEGAGRAKATNKARAKGWKIINVREHVEEVTGSV